jgi:hypothetical protein
LLKERVKTLLLFFEFYLNFLYVICRYITSSPPFEFECEMTGAVVDFPECVFHMRLASTSPKPIALSSVGPEALLSTYSTPVVLLLPRPVLLRPPDFVQTITIRLRCSHVHGNQIGFVIITVRQVQLEM